MTPERWQQVKEIFNSAIAIGGPEREVFLSQACSGDYSLRSEVESLIAAHEKSGEFIDSPAYQAAAGWIADGRAELKTGQIIGSYEILSFISRGGMGEVYLAQDKRLNRKLALKVLPASFTRDTDRLRRFEQEARSASALNHPNIITIYEITEANGTHVIATEFVEGETLRQRLSHGVLSLEESLSVAMQTADALGAAHKVGITHRDIKPENIMLRPDGYVKVLDFGLAKLTEQLTPAVAAEAPTVQVRTGSGIVIGTAGYMSPEQARGVPVDGRSDIFSLGAVIYEMVARRKPFEGDTPSDTLASILKTEPIPLSRVAPTAPAELVRIVTKALRKDREERYQVVKDLWLDLKALKQELDFQEKLERSVVPNNDATPTVAIAAGEPTGALSGTHATSSRSAIGTITESLSIEIKKHKTGTALMLAALLLVVASASFGIYKYVNRPTAIEHFWDIKLARLTNSGNVIDAAISPDGKYLAYVLSDRSSQSLWLRQVTAANDTQIVAPAPVGYFGISFSSDGTELYYAIKSDLNEGTLFRMPVLGGTPVKVLQNIDSPVSFSADGKQFVFARANYPGAGESALIVANADGSGEYTLAVKKLPEKFSPIFFTGPSWSPDNKLIAATVNTLGGKSRVVAYSVAEHTEESISTQTWPFTSRVEWLRDMTGLMLIAGNGPSDSQLWIIDHSTGRARRVTNDLNPYRSISMTLDGKKCASVQANGLVNLWIAPDGDASRAIRLPTGNVGFYAGGGNNLSWTPDGRIVFVSTEGGRQDIWSANPDGSSRKQLTTTGEGNLNPFVSGDGRFIVFVSWREGERSLWRMNIDGSNPVRLTPGPTDGFPSTTSDGKWVIYIAVANAKPTIWKISIEGGSPTEVLDQPASYALVSPDGKWLMYFFPQSTAPFAPPNRIAITPFETKGETKTFSIAANGTVSQIGQWSSDSKAIYYTSTTNNVTNIWSQSIDGGPPKQLTKFNDSLMTGFSWSRDGKQLACTRGILVRDAVLVTDVK